MNTLGVENIVEKAISTTTLESTPKWVEFQKATFTNWINEVLKNKREPINDIQTDFRDGLVLIDLLECISNKKVQGVKNKSLEMNQYQMRENLDICLQFMKDENFSLVHDISK